MIDPRWEEQAALHSLGGADDAAELARAAARDPELAAAIREFDSVAAFLVFDSAQTPPPPALRSRILRQIKTPQKGASTRQGWNFSWPFPHLALPYALAACLMGLVLAQGALILMLDHRLDDARVRRAAMVAAAERDPLTGVQLATLAPQDNTHGDAKVMVAWDAHRCCGMVSLDKMPAAPAGQDYQLWVLDPSKPAPVSAGVVTHGVNSQHFMAEQVHMPGRPGFALSMEPAGGRPTPTAGQILFAVAPSP